MNMYYTSKVKIARDRDKADSKFYKFLLHVLVEIFMVVKSSHNFLPIFIQYRENTLLIIVKT